MRENSSLRLEREPGQYGFIHLTLEEALAAYGLVEAGQLDLSKNLTYVERHLADPGWRETILLAVGVCGLVHGTANLN